MGICCSSNSGKEREWKLENDSNKFNSKLRKEGANDFSSLFSKFNGVGVGGGGAAAMAAQERALHQIPGRLFVNGSNKIACLHTQQGKKGTNQDAMIFWEDFCSFTDTVFCGVFDGHGPYGHMVARKIRDCLPLLLRKEWESISKDDQNLSLQNLGDDVYEDDCCESMESEGIENFPNIHLSLKMSILKAFKLMDEELNLHPTMDCFCSGSTAVTLIMKGQDLIIGNVGDSRAVLATRDDDNTLSAVQLTVDLKPNLPREAARIAKYKGRVFALQDEPEVARVWLPNSDSPGLAMARAFGDFCLKDFGLISVPDVYYHPITPKDEFVVLASDGIWDVLSNKEAVDVVASAPSRATSARALVDSATRAWRLKYPTSKMDDCAAVCLFLDHHPSSGDITVNESLKHGTTATSTSVNNTNANVREDGDSCQTSVYVRDYSGEIEQVVEESAEKKVEENGIGDSKRSLAECISSGQDEEDWSALEGVTRINSFVSIPRFLSVEKRTTGRWRKWL